MPKAKRAYAKERREATRYADAAMCDVVLERSQWLRCWGFAYEGYLAGLRRSAPSGGAVDGS